MNKGGTSTKGKAPKKVNKNTKHSTSPSSAKPKKPVAKKSAPVSKGKKVVKKAPQKPQPKKQEIKKKVVNKPVNKVQSKKVKPKVKEVDDNIIELEMDSRPDLNIVDVEEYREFNEEKRTKNNIRAPKKENIKKEPTIKIKSSTVLKFTFLIGSVIAIGYLMFNLEFFNLKEIKVSNNIKYTNDEIIKSTNLKIGKNVFKQLFFDDKIKENLPYVYKLRFGYSIPDGISIHVEERFPAYIAKDKKTEKCYLIDNEGVILEECSDSQRQDELLIEGFVFEEGISAGQKIDDVYMNKIQIYHQIKDLFESANIEGIITKVRFSGSLTTVTLDGKLRIKFANDSNLGYKVSFLKSIIDENGGNVEGIIDMSVENPVYSKYD